MVNMSSRENLVTDMVTASLCIMLPRLLFLLFIRGAYCRPDASSIIPLINKFFLEKK